MRLALIVDDYLPESTRVAAKMMHELAVDLNSKGHEVVVITIGSASQTDRLCLDRIDGVDVWRFKSGAVKDISLLRRLINESLLSFNAKRALKTSSASLSFDGVVYYSPSIFFGPLVSWLKKINSCPSYLILRDLFPQWALDEGIISEGNPVTAYLRFFERLNYRAADVIGVMSQNNLNVFSKMQPELTNVHVLNNWARLQPVDEDANQHSFRATLGLQDKVVFFYGGNIGRAQDMENLVRLARGMKAEANAHFLFLGQGDEVDLVKGLIDEWSLTNTTFLPSVSQEEFKLILAEVDVGLFSLAKNHTAHNFPGKLLGYMVEAVPILGSVNRGNDLMDVVNNDSAGFVFINGDDHKLLESAINLCRSPEKRSELGGNARSLLEQQFSVESAASVIVEGLGRV